MEHNLKINAGLDVKGSKFLWVSCNCGWGTAGPEEVSLDQLEKIKVKHIEDFHEWAQRPLVSDLSSYNIPVVSHVSVPEGMAILVNHAGEIIKVIKL